LLSTGGLSKGPSHVCHLALVITKPRIDLAAVVASKGDREPGRRPDGTDQLVGIVHVVNVRSAKVAGVLAGGTALLT
jgi:hypothetical protein